MDPIFLILVLVRWLHFGAVFVLFGGALFRAYAPDDPADAWTRRSDLRRARIAAPVALVTGAGWLAATIVYMTGSPDALVDGDTLHAFFLETSFGPFEAARLVLLVAVVVLAFAPMRDRVRSVALAVASGVLLASQAWLGHAAEGGGTLLGAVAIASYAIHVLAGAAWLGGLPSLLTRMVATHRRAGPHPASMLPRLSRYSRMATRAVCLILASGVANSAFRVAGHLGAFWSTRYGAVLLAKLVLVGLMLAFAAYNRFVAIPVLEAMPDEARVTRRLVASIACEILLGALVLAAAAVLGITPPPAM